MKRKKTYNLELPVNYEHFKGKVPVNVSFALNLSEITDRLDLICKKHKQLSDDMDYFYANIALVKKSE